MNYQKIYNDLVNRGKSRIWPEDVYGEWHHIVPRCLAGGNDPENLVKLMPEEHYVAHQLLVKIHPGNAKLIYAASMMTVDNRGGRVNNKLYGWLKRARSIAFSKMMQGTVSGMAGKLHSEEAKRKISEANKGRTFSPETKMKMSKSQMGNKNSLGKTHSEETKLKISVAKIGKKLSPETILKMSAARTGKKRSDKVKLEMSRRQKGISKPVSEAAHIASHSPESILKAKVTKKRNKEFKQMSQLMECLL